MPTYSQRFNKQERSLPDLGSRPFAKEYFPSELHDTLDGLDEPAGKRRKTNKNKALVLSNITSLRTAEEVFLSDAAQQSSVTNAGDPNKALQVLERIDNNEDGGVADELFLEDDDEWVRTANEDGEDVGEDEDQYEDESDDDYNAEQYFSENQVDDDFDDGGDGGGDDYF
ncbi:hypothetical protein VTK73DRAFT_5209 [Phialemonium thermophilum]|uniref:DNA-directed RNA polymerase III subunit n=1 Tax=Phialemonium thermophilum TaxID=223376 RepID=A0ABR3WPR1_9PEZI